MDIAALRSLVERYHVHFDVEPELDVQDRHRVRVGVSLRIWGVHARRSGAYPGCPRCRELTARLRAIAAYALDSETEGLRIEIGRPAPALYDSRIVTGSDEVALPILIGHAAGWTTPIDGRADGLLKRLRARLREIGAPER